MTKHDKDVLAVCYDLLEKAPKGTIIEMKLSFNTFKIEK